MKNIKKLFEEVKPDFFYKRRPYRLYRKDLGSGRFYYEFVGDEVRHFISITNVQDKLLPKGIEFYKWVMKNGGEAETIRDAAAAYGTAYHVCCSMKVKDGGFDFDWLSRITKGKTNFENMLGDYAHMAPRWIEGFKKGLTCFFQFLEEKVTEIYAIELPIRSHLGYAATLDMVCELTFGGKQVVAAVDFKSMILEPGSTKKKEFHDGHEFQLEGQKFAWNENFPELPITHVFNFAPTNFKGEVPTYELKNQTQNKFSRDIITQHGPINLFVMKMLEAKAMGYLNKPSSKFSFIQGKFEGNFDASKHIIQYQL